MLLVGLVSVSQAMGDWPEFRGPNQNGTTTDFGLPLTWNESQNILWYAPTDGLGWSSPVVYKGKIYFTAAVNNDRNEPAKLEGGQRLKLICLSAADGGLMFQRELLKQPENAPKIHKKNSHASPTVVAHDDRLYVHFGHQGTVCTDLNGTVLWENREHPYPPTHGNGGSPILVDDKLIFTCDGGTEPCTLALDIATGKERWRTLRGVEADRKFSFSTPQWIQVDGVPQIISPGSNIVQSISPTDGSVLWSVSYEGFSVIPRPVYYQGLVYVCTGYSTAQLIAIDPTGRGDVTDSHVRWIHRSNVPLTPSLVGANNSLIMTSDGGVATALDPVSGMEKWRKRLGGNYSASPLVAGDRVYFQSESGESVVLALGEQPQEIARNVLPGRIFASFAVVDGDLIVRAEQGVYRISNK